MDKFLKVNTSSRWILMVIVGIHIVAAAKDIRTNICEQHPYISRSGSGKADSNDAKNWTNTDFAPKCSLVFDFESSNKDEQKRFCESRYYENLVNWSYEEAKKELECVYEAYTYCDGTDIPILGNCFRHKSTAKNLAEARKECGIEKMKLAQFYDQTGLEWIYSLHDPNPDTFTPDVWIDSSIEEFYLYDRIIEEVPESKTASVLMFRYGPGNERPAFYRAADPKEKHQFYCVAPAKRYPSAFRHYCDIIREEFNLAAAYHQSTCYILSLSVHVPKFDATKLEVINKPYNEYCQFTEGMNSYAVAPTSRTRFDGMVKAVLSKFKNDGKTPRVVTPGKKKSKIQETFRTRCYLQAYYPKLQKNMFVYYGADGKEYNVDTSGWDGWALMELCADLHRDIIVLAPHSGKHVWYTKYPFGDEAILSAYDYPRFFRGHIVCAAGFQTSDLPSTQCDATWKALTTDSGTTICHKPIIKIDGKYLTDTPRDKMLQACIDIGGQFLSPIESAREHNEIYELLLQTFKKENRSTYGSAYAGMSTDTYFDFFQDYNKENVYYTNWDNVEPNNGGYRNEQGYDQKCMQLVMNPYEGRWNDIQCDGSWREMRYISIAGMCAKFAN